MLTDEAIDKLNTICGKVCADFGANLVALDGEDDHAHLLVEYPPQVQLSKLVHSLKGVSSRLLRKELPGLAARYWKGVLWSPSYLRHPVAAHRSMSSRNTLITSGVRRLYPRPEVPGFYAH